MPGASNASTSSVGHGTESSTMTAIHIHSNHVSQRELIQVLRDGCKPDTFNIEMRHNVYTVYLEKDSVDHVVSSLLELGLERSQWLPADD